MTMKASRNHCAFTVFFFLGLCYIASAQESAKTTVPAPSAETECFADGTCTSADNDNTPSGIGRVTEETPPCLDEEQECGMWADSGECEKNPNYMMNNCRISCLVCTE